MPELLRTMYAMLIISLSELPVLFVAFINNGVRFFSITVRRHSYGNTGPVVSLAGDLAAFAIHISFIPPRLRKKAATDKSDILRVAFSAFHDGKHADERQWRLLAGLFRKCRNWPFRSIFRRLKSWVQPYRLMAIGLNQPEPSPRDATDYWSGCEIGNHQPGKPATTHWQWRTVSRTSETKVITALPRFTEQS